MPFVAPSHPRAALAPLALPWALLPSTFGANKTAAEAAFLKALELEPRDAESLHSLGDLFCETDRDRAVKYYHRYLTVAPTGIFHNPKLKRTLTEAALSWLTGWSLETDGKISIFPPPPPGAATKPAEIALVDFDTSTQAGIDRMIDFFLTPPDQRDKFAARVFRSAYPATNPSALAKAAAVGRNSPCPCGSGRKYKTCCGKK